MSAAATGLLAEYASAEALANALGHLRAGDCVPVETYGPLPPGDVGAGATTLRPHSIAIAAFCGGLAFAALGYAMQFFSAVIDYPVNVGGRPDDSVIAFIPATLELTLLGAALAALVAFVRSARLFRFHHPLFDVDAFARATRDRYFVLVRNDGTERDATAARALLRATAALAIHEVRDDAA